MDRFLIEMLIIGIQAAYWLHLLLITEENHDGPISSKSKILVQVHTNGNPLGYRPVSMIDRLVRRPLGVYQKSDTVSLGDTEVKTWSIRFGSGAYDLFTCPFCLSFWVSILFSVPFMLFSWNPDPIWVIPIHMFITTVAYSTHGLFFE